LNIRHSIINQDNSLAWGITLVDEDALTAGSLPDANEEIEQPGWMFRGASDYSVSNVFDFAQYLFINADLKGQRKFAGNNARLVFLASNVGASNVIISGMIRMIVKKP